jgi:hypothetical protein
LGAGRVDPRPAPKRIYTGRSVACAASTSRPIWSINIAQIMKRRDKAWQDAVAVALNLTCAECGRSPRAGETWRIVLADIGEAVTYYPECAEREFGEPD